MVKLPRVCVIGAGASGITTIKALKDRGVPFDCFDKGDRPGGMWVFKNVDGVSGIYRSLHINTSRQRMTFHDFPMPETMATFPHHSEIQAYYEDYIDHFQLRDRITWRTAVVHAMRLPDGVWKVEIDSGETRWYDALIVCNGHHWDPRWPDPPFPGRFDGPVIHSHHYIDPRDPVDLIGKRVLVLGMGNSAMDICSELGMRGNAERVYLAARRGAHIVPKQMFGRPLDSFPNNPRIPINLRIWIARLVHRIAVGKMESYGLPKPDHDFGHAHPTISSEILYRISAGDVLVRPNIAELQCDRVKFTDGRVEQIDAIIYCTGYKISFPFLDPAVLNMKNNEIPLFFNVMKPGVGGLFFVGLVQPLGPVMPIAEEQARWVGDTLIGAYSPPPDNEMLETIRQASNAMAKRYVASKRHTIQVDFDDYLYALSRERKRGASRAKRNPRRIATASETHCNLQPEPTASVERSEA